MATVPWARAAVRLPPSRSVGGSSPLLSSQQLLGRAFSIDWTLPAPRPRWEKGRPGDLGLGLSHSCATCSHGV